MMRFLSINNDVKLNIFFNEKNVAFLYDEPESYNTMLRHCDISISGAQPGFL